MTKAEIMKKVIADELQAVARSTTHVNNAVQGMWEFFGSLDATAAPNEDDRPRVNADQLTRALLKTHGRYDSKQDQADAIIEILKEDKPNE